MSSRISQFSPPAPESAGSRTLRAGPMSSRGEKNVGNWERVASAVGGTLLVGNAFRLNSNPQKWLSGIAGLALIVRAWRGRCPVYQAAGITTWSPSTHHILGARRGIRFEAGIVVQAAAIEVYDFLRDFRNLPVLFDSLEKVEEIERVAHWRAKGLRGKQVLWKTTIVEDKPGDVIAWRSLPGAGFKNAGTFRLNVLPNLRGGTAVRLIVRYELPMGKAGDQFLKWMGTDLQGEMKRGLRRLKQLLETGEIASTEGQPRGRCS